MKRKRGRKFVWEPKKEIKVQKVSSKSLFRDRRIGEKDTRMAQEERSLRRFQLQRSRMSRKKKFQLDDEYELTHRGKTLSQLQDDYIQEYIQDSDDQVVKKRKVLKQRKIQVQKSKKQSHLDMIEKYKLKKQKRLNEKEDDLELVLKLDKQFNKLTQKVQYKKIRTQEVDDYDRLVNSLRSGKKQQPNTQLRKQKKDIQQKRKILIDKGQNWEILEYQQFLEKTKQNILNALKSYLDWGENGQKLTEYSIKGLMEFDLQSIYQQNKQIQLVQLYRSIISKNFQVFTDTLSKICSQQQDLTLNYATLYYISGSVIDQSEDIISSHLKDLTCYMLLYYPLSCDQDFRNLILLMAIHWEIWIKPQNQFSPELIRCLNRILDQSEGTYSPTPLISIFTNLTTNTVYSLCYSLYTQIHTHSPPSVALNDILGRFFPSELIRSSAPAQSLFEQSVFEIPTYEPQIHDKITSFKKARDLNKDLNQIQALKKEHRKGKSAAKRVLNKEAQMYEQQQLQERQLRQKFQQSQQKRIRGLLDQLQEEHKKLMTSNEILKKKKKKRRQLKAGNKSQLSKQFLNLNQT